ncbi:hypothetical protein [Kiloniella sp.]|uniref:hypothetical protein n=1 Tax=Kiloniella sp. TaxID=1938587 RepID=UPI003B016BC9
MIGNRNIRKNALKIFNYSLEYINICNAVDIDIYLIRLFPIYGFKIESFSINKGRMNYA